MKVLNVAEKNDAAKNIANCISRGGNRWRDGLSKFNKIYEFNTQLWNQNCQMLMTSVSGHLLTYEFVGNYRKWHGCHPLSLFEAPVVKNCPDDFIKIKQTLEREVKSCNALIIWTDCDREGENIGFEIIKVCTAIKPNIRVYRAKFSEITNQSISRALATLGEPNKAVSDAVDVRSELDLRIGAAFTRFQTLRLQKVFPQKLADMLISYGSCQFPTLGFVVERFLAIERFQPETYWKIKVLDVRNDLHVEFRWARNRLFEKLPCQVLFEMCQENPVATVEKVTSKPKSKWRPLPLDTVELEKLGSRKLRLSAKETMQAAEKLYTQGFISYPRTETNIFPKELNLQPLVQQQTESGNWGDFAQRVLQDGINPRQGKKSDQAHPPIHPIKFANNLHGNEAKVYEFVVRHFLACIAKNAEGQETIVDIDIAGEKFIANGLQIIAKNYLDVYVYEKWNAKEIHAYEQGQNFRPTSIEMPEEKTSPPNLLTEADLIALMDKHGIGTDATHAEHIETIKKREYVGLTANQHFMPGKLGIGLVMGYDKMGFQMSKPNLRAELENDLKLICEGQKNPNDVLTRQVTKYRDVFKIALERANLIDTSLAEYLDDVPVATADIEIPEVAMNPTILKCPRCGFDMTLKDRRNQEGKYISCMNFPACSNAIWLPLAVVNVEVQDQICNQCPGGMHKLKFKFKPGAMPRFGVEYTTCIGGCDEIFNDSMDIKLNNVRNTGRSNDSGYQSSNSTQRSSQSNSSSQRNNNATSSTNNSRSMSQARQQQSQGNSNNTVQFRQPENTRQQNGWSRQNNQETRTNVGMVTSNANSNSNISQNWGSVDDGSAILCNCHNPAIQLTVRKDGPNIGRQFFKCAQPQGSGCNYFMWASSDENNSTGTQPPPSGGNTYNQNTQNDWRNNYNAPGPSTNWSNSNNLNTSGDNVTCNCGQPAKKLTVQKEGVNKGRQFYGCPKGMQSTCKFFQWADETNANASYRGDDDDGGGDGGGTWGGGNRGGGNWGGGDWGSSSSGRGRGRGGNAPKKPRAPGAKRKCGICGTEGHTKKTCPRNSRD
ncbi:DNA topoisomerase 3-alpha isoform X2 [Leptopilina boulardi]|nr:DNA topoisomerase 3-alpha isoform X2 [Leptopilina boulardi]